MHLSHDRHERIAAFEQRCREQHLALTVQRRAIFTALLDRQDHPTADMVYDAVHETLPGVSRATVYRVLETLVQTGVIAKACHPGAAARYDALMRRHHHLVCLHCEKVMDLEDARYDALPMPQIKAGKFEITDYCVHFRGICADCRAKDKTMSPAHSVAGRQTPRTAARPTHTRARNRRNTT